MTKTKDRQRIHGLVLVILSAAIFSTAGLFVKGVQADGWTIIFWRGIFAAGFTFLYLIYNGSVQSEITRMGRYGVLAALVGASGTIAFIPSFKYTTIANVSLIYAAAPLVSAAIAWLWFREKPSRVVFIASMLALAGVLIIVSGSFGSLHLRGDALALWMTIAMAAYLCIYRRYPDTPAAGPAMLLSLLLVPLGFIFSNPFAAPLHEIVIMGSFGLIFAVASVTLAEGAKRLPAAETALLSSLETPLAPIWAILVFSEFPATTTLIGGGLIFVVILWSQYKESRN